MKKSSGDLSINTGTPSSETAAFSIPYSSSLMRSGEHYGSSATPCDGLADLSQDLFSTTPRTGNSHPATGHTEVTGSLTAPFSFITSTAAFSNLRQTSSMIRRESIVEYSAQMVESMRTGANLSKNALHEVAPEERSSSTFLAGWNVTNLIQGIGILGIPYAIMLGGIPALVATVVFAALTCYTGKLLIKCLYLGAATSPAPLNAPDEDNVAVLNEAPRLHSYPCVGMRVWPRFGLQFVTSIAMVEMFGAVVLYVILLSKMAVNVMDHFPDYQLPIQYWTLISSYSLVPFLMVTRLSIISWFSFVAVLALFAIIFLVMLFCFVHLNYAYCWSHLTTMNVQDLPVSLGIIIFSYCAHVVFPSIESSMHKPQSFNRMMNVSFGIAALVKFLFGGLAVLMFGPATEQEITANMRISPVFSILICSLVFFNVFFSFPILAYVICERMDHIVLPKMVPMFQPTSDGWAHHYWLLLSRLTLVTAAVLTAMIVPHFALLMGLIGSFTGCMLCFVFPGYFYLKLNPYQSRMEKVGHGAIVLLGMLVGIMGITFSLKSIIETIGVED